jgi:alpha-L-fucosidase
VRIRIHHTLLSLSLFALLVSAAPGRQSHNVVLIPPGASASEIVRIAAGVTPSQKQLAWQQMEFTGFVHFGINTFYDQEWGKGNEDPARFNPTNFDARQWAQVFQAAGMKLVILTAKHHDGFCLWPSAYTDHSVKNSPWKNGKGDVVREFTDALREVGLKIGLYLSPWDRHEPTYGDSPVYNEHFRNQLRELLTNYGEIDEVWFDGANGEGPNGKRQVYDWQSYYALIRQLQPNAVIAIMGPDVRWVGTESGYGRETEWSVLPNLLSKKYVADEIGGRFEPDRAFVPRDLTAPDLGSRGKLTGAYSLSWYPSETDVSIRPGWFYHASQDTQVKSPSKLVDIYYSSVGRNSVLLLNVPPDTRGRISDSDVKSLLGMRKILDETFEVNIATGAAIRASSEARGHNAQILVGSHNGDYWTTQGEVDTVSIDLWWDTAKTFDRLLLQEEIELGQRIESFRLEAFISNGWQEIARGSTVGYKRLLRFPTVSAAKARLVIEQSRSNPTLSAFGLYRSPE